MSHREVYHRTASAASASVVIGSVVTSHQRTGSCPAGGCSSSTRIAVIARCGNCLRRRWVEGGATSRAANRIVRVARRAGRAGLAPATVGAQSPADRPTDRRDIRPKASVHRRRPSRRCKEQLTTWERGNEFSSVPTTIWVWQAYSEPPYPVATSASPAALSPDRERATAPSSRLLHHPHAPAGERLLERLLDLGRLADLAVDHLALRVEQDHRGGGDDAQLVGETAVHPA